MLGLKWTLKDFFYMFLGGLFVVVFSTIVIYATDSKMVVVDEHNPKAQKVLEPVEGDFIIGDKNAPVEVVFYGDFTCHHCMRFMKDNFFKLRDEYIFTKKVKFIFRPVITLKRSLYGAKFLFCDKRNDDLNADILWKMFDKKWMMSDDYINSLANLVKKENWTNIEHFVECTNSKEIQDNLHKMYKQTVEPLNIHETPHVFVNKMPTATDKTMFVLIDKEYRKLKNKR